MAKRSFQFVLRNKGNILFKINLSIRPDNENFYLAGSIIEFTKWTGVKFIFCLFNLFLRISFGNTN